MVRRSTPADILETCIAPYKKLLDLRLPIEYQLNDECCISTISFSDRHVISYDPDLTLLPLTDKTRAIPSPIAIKDDKARLSSLVFELCRMHLAEKIDAVLSMPYLAGEENPMETEFSFYHNQVVSMWSNDVLHQFWPELFVAHHQEYNKAFRVKWEFVNEHGDDPKDMLLTMLIIAQHHANTLRHNLSLEDECFTLIERCNPVIAKNMGEFSHYWTSLPCITYDRQKDMKHYERAVKRTAELGCMKAKPELMRKDGEWVWGI